MRPRLTLRKKIILAVLAVLASRRSPPTKKNVRSGAGVSNPADLWLAPQARPARGEGKGRGGKAKRACRGRGRASSACLRVGWLAGWRVGLLGAVRLGLAVGKKEYSKPKVPGEQSALGTFFYVWGSTVLLTGRKEFACAGRKGSRVRMFFPGAQCFFSAEKKENHQQIRVIKHQQIKVFWPEKKRII